MPRYLLVGAIDVWAEFTSLDDASAAQQFRAVLDQVAASLPSGLVRRIGIDARPQVHISVSGRGTSGDCDDCGRPIWDDERRDETNGHSHRTCPRKEAA